MNYEHKYIPTLDSLTLKLFKLIWKGLVHGSTATITNKARTFYFEKEMLLFQEGNDVYRYLSGVAVTPRTQFLQLGQPEVMQQYKLVIHYMKFAMAAYGWPIFMMMNTGTGLCRIVPYLR